MGVQAATVKVHVLRAERVIDHPHPTFIELSIGSSRIRTEQSHNNIWNHMYALQCPTGDQSSTELVLKLKSSFKSQTLGKFKTPLRKLMTQGLEAPYPLLDDGGKPAGMLIMRMWVSEQREIPANESPLRRSISTRGTDSSGGSPISIRHFRTKPSSKASYTAQPDSPSLRRRAATSASGQPPSITSFQQTGDGTFSEPEITDSEIEEDSHRLSSNDSFRGKVMARARSLSRGSKGNPPVIVAPPPVYQPNAPPQAPEDALTSTKSNSTNAELEELRLSREKLARRCAELETIIMSPLTSFAPVELKEKESNRSVSVPPKFSQPDRVTMDMPSPDNLTATFSEGFSQSLCGCISEDTFLGCLASCFLPCVVSAYTQAAVEERTCTVYDAVCYNAYLTKQSVRARHQLGYSPCCDCCVILTCLPCAVSQTSREHESRIKMSKQYQFGDYGKR
eukprot:CFRG2525T1